MAKVLMVDDEYSMRFTMKQFLLGDGHEVDTAENVAEAKELINRSGYDVVVSDIILPGPAGSGLDLLRAVREKQTRTQVILITGAPTVETAADAVRSGATDYLVKPITKLDILRAVNLAAKVKTLEDLKVRLEEAERRHHEEVEDLVAKRTHELSEANCRLSNAMEELKRTQLRLIEQERLNALGQMASGIAHDFNNILMPILGYSEMLLSEAAAGMSPEDRQGALRDIHVAPWDAKEIVRRLRELYKPKETLPLQNINLKALLEKVARLTEPAWKTQSQVNGHPITLSVSADPSLSVTGSETPLSEALTNLVLNSVDAMPAGGRIDLAAAGDGKRVVLTVKDTGTGMTEEVRRRCLDPFFSTKGDRGTGLGLSICYGVVRRLEGQMEVISEPNKGTTIEIRLPQSGPAAFEGKPDKPAATARKWARILVADDDSRTRTILSRYLKGAAGDVVMASGGKQAIAFLAGQRFDLVITDRAMPDTNGDDVAKAAKAANPPVPVVMLTGLGDIMKSSRQLPDGVDRLLSKPVTAFELLEAMEGL